MTVKELLGPKNYCASTIIRLYNGNDLVELKSDPEAFTSSADSFNHSSVGSLSLI